ncbi:MAG: hypothetical protein ACOX48_03930 [Limnochordia bacterium]|nr:MAG: hypothetical protein AA931_06900 [Peptococcaceae bacterium 1109]
MNRNYREMVQEVKEITSLDGFIAACLEIKESMFFYERDLVLAAYGASVELLTIGALFIASLEGDDCAEEVYEELSSALRGLIESLHNTLLPLDIQYLGEHYVRGAAYAAQMRLPVYGKMMEYYRSGIYEAYSSIDDLLREGQQRLYGTSDSAIDHILGLVGARMLRGEHLRPIWLHITHPRIRIVLSGMQTMVNNFKVAPYFGFPFEDIATERQKRTKVGNNVVVDLGAFRNFRRAITGYTDLRIVLDQDEYDRFFEELFVRYRDGKLPEIQPDPDPTVVNILLAVLEARLVTPDLDEVFLEQAAAVLAKWKVREAAQVAVRLLEKLDPWDPEFQVVLDLLRSLDGKAVSAMRRHLKNYKNTGLAVVFADLLSRGSKGKRKLALLSDIFQEIQWGHGKEEVAMAVARFGGPEAEALLQETIASLSEPERQYQPYLERAVQYLRERGMENGKAPN